MDGFVSLEPKSQNPQAREVAGCEAPAVRAACQKATVQVKEAAGARGPWDDWQRLAVGWGGRSLRIVELFGAEASL